MIFLEVESLSHYLPWCIYDSFLQVFLLKLSNHYFQTFHFSVHFNNIKSVTNFLIFLPAKIIHLSWHLCKAIVKTKNIRLLHCNWWMRSDCLLDVWIILSLMLQSTADYCQHCTVVLPMIVEIGSLTKLRNSWRRANTYYFLRIRQDYSRHLHLLLNFILSGGNREILYLQSFFAPA